jgi:transcriptional regulator with XRE-family HTH domain
MIHFPAQELLRQLKEARQAAGLTLAAVSRRCGLDQPALSRLENAHVPNPTVDTLWRYAAALGKRLVLSAVDVPDTQSRNVSSAPGRAVAQKPTPKKKKRA